MEQSDQIKSEKVNDWRKTVKRICLVCGFILAIMITAGFTYAATMAFVKAKYAAENGHLVESVKELRDVISEKHFYYDNDETKMTDAALKAIAEATGDAYAEYYTEQEYAELTKQNDRNFVGIGILTQLNENGEVEIIDVYEDTPASEAGLRPGDIIREINGTAYDGDTLTDFLANVHAEEGETNTFVIRRGEEQLAFDIVAREVHTPSVSYRMLTDTIGYIHIQTFHGTCVDETKTAMKELRESGMQSLVLDLRDNLGGSLGDAVDIVDIFLPKDYVVTTLRSRDGEVTEYKTSDKGIDIRMALLVNGYSASASELVAGALKDYEAAYLIGTQTYGKGIVQSFYKISETNGWIKLTTDAYYTPNGICVQDQGITPDRIIDLTDEAKQYTIERIPFEIDDQLQAAIAYLEE